MNIPNFNNYTIIREIGKGGMATVYLAKHKLMDIEVAIKVLKPEFYYNSNIKGRFLSEAKKIFQLNHPNIVGVKDLVEENGNVAIVMDYIKGKSLREILSQKRLNDTEIENYLSQMVEGIKYIHSKNLIHRDIKPSNFLIGKDGVLKLTDFGISKDGEGLSYEETQTLMTMGTPMYMSPEQVKSAKYVTASTDIYSLGVVLWEMVTGKKPYDEKSVSFFELQGKIVNEDLSKTGTKWDEVIQKATKKKIENRIKELSNFTNKQAKDESEKTIIIGGKDIKPTTNNGYWIIRFNKNYKLIINLGWTSFFSLILLFLLIFGTYRPLFYYGKYTPLLIPFFLIFVLMTGLISTMKSMENIHIFKYFNEEEQRKINSTHKKGKRGLILSIISVIISLFTYCYGFYLIFSS